MKHISIYIIIMLVIISCLCLTKKESVQAGSSTLGNGTKDNPYTISNVEELLDFANSVNNGNSYEGEFILQTNDINLEGVEWETIGAFGSENSFKGIYDGDGHIISNLYVTTDGNNAFFGQLGGTVMNLGIVSGYIEGTCVGSFTSHASDLNATIINCYNGATVYGARAGGIADNFNGTIANCLTECELLGDSVGGIVSYDAKALINNISIEEAGKSTVFRNGVEYVNKGVDYAEIVERMNKNIYYCAYVSGIDYHDLNLWKLDKENKIIFSADKASFEMEYKGSYMKIIFLKYLPYLLIISTVCLIVMLVKNSSYKR